MQTNLVILISLAAFLVFVLLQSWFINGIYMAANGETQKRPDGSDDDSEMILYPLKKWLTRTRTKIIYYTDAEQLDRLFSFLQSRYGSILSNEFKIMWNLYNDGWSYVSAGDNEKLLELLERRLRADEAIGVKREEAENGLLVRFSFYKEYDEYLVSKWLRKPLIECPACMASFWGSLTFWIASLVWTGFHWWQPGVWIGDLGVLCYLNMFWLKKR